eukprot:Cvel_13635.t1-p1 / transcript=Cvel_13635.t1 / gene=Cvel_13635 / organism=Chromera_velia_CCMP2878 / gene_product=hypothetical protein / transcript_product=hypothetical protein / location=Cvel_scaffold940:1-5052(-) / protein_length=1278 / sequence_SO=supercontig / SO=protein_coding / is_pseudo=false
MKEPRKIYEKKLLIRERLIQLLQASDSRCLSLRSVGNDDKIRLWCKKLKLLYVIEAFPMDFAVRQAADNRYFVCLRGAAMELQVQKLMGGFVASEGGEEESRDGGEEEADIEGAETAEEAFSLSDKRECVFESSLGCLGDVRGEAGARPISLAAASHAQPQATVTHDHQIASEKALNHGAGASMGSRQGREGRFACLRKFLSLQWAGRGGEKKGHPSATTGLGETATAELSLPLAADGTDGSPKNLKTAEGCWGGMSRCEVETETETGRSALTTTAAELPVHLMALASARAPGPPVGRGTSNSSWEALDVRPMVERSYSEIYPRRFELSELGGGDGSCRSASFAGTPMASSLGDEADCRGDGDGEMVEDGVGILNGCGIGDEDEGVDFAFEDEDTVRSLLSGLVADTATTASWQCSPAGLGGNSDKGRDEVSGAPPKEVATQMGDFCAARPMEGVCLPGSSWGLMQQACAGGERAALPAPLSPSSSTEVRCASVLADRGIAPPCSFSSSSNVPVLSSPGERFQRKRNERGEMNISGEFTGIETDEGIENGVGMGGERCIVVTPPSLRPFPPCSAHISSPMLSHCHSRTPSTSTNLETATVSRLPIHPLQVSLSCLHPATRLPPAPPSIAVSVISVCPESERSPALALEVPCIRPPELLGAGLGGGSSDAFGMGGSTRGPGGDRHSERGESANRCLMKAHGRSSGCRIVPGSSPVGSSPPRTFVAGIISPPLETACPSPAPSAPSPALNSSVGETEAGIDRERESDPGRPPAGSKDSAEGDGEVNSHNNHNNNSNEVVVFRLPELRDEASSSSFCEEGHLCVPSEGVQQEIIEGERDQQQKRFKNDDSALSSSSSDRSQGKETVERSEGKKVGGGLRHVNTGFRYQPHAAAAMPVVSVPGSGPSSASAVMTAGGAVGARMLQAAAVHLDAAAAPFVPFPVGFPSEQQDQLSLSEPNPQSNPIVEMMRRSHTSPLENSQSQRPDSKFNQGANTRWGEAGLSLAPETQQQLGATAPDSTDFGGDLSSSANWLPPPQIPVHPHNLMAPPSSPPSGFPSTISDPSGISSASAIEMLMRNWQTPNAFDEGMQGSSPLSSPPVGSAPAPTMTVHPPGPRPSTAPPQQQQTNQRTGSLSKRELSRQQNANGGSPSVSRSQRQNGRKTSGSSSSCVSKSAANALHKNQPTVPPPPPPSSRVPANSNQPPPPPSPLRSPTPQMPPPRHMHMGATQCQPPPPPLAPPSQPPPPPLSMPGQQPTPGAPHPPSPPPAPVHIPPLPLGFQPP